MVEAAISCRDLTKRYGPVAAVDSVSLVVPVGETLALLGPSGCGKTTLLRLIAGFETPDSGTISIRGREVVGRRKVVPPNRRHIGFVFQDYALFPHLTVAGNVGFGLKGSKQKRERVAEMLRLVGLEHKGEQMPHELSGGQQQRVALARALAPGPDVVLLDEPFSNLDATLRVQMREDLNRIGKEAGATAIYVTHDREEALDLGTRIAVMEHGKILEMNTPREIYLHPHTRQAAQIVGFANFIKATAHEGMADCALGRFKLARPCTHGPIDLLLRPETLRVQRLGADASSRRNGSPAPGGGDPATQLYGGGPAPDASAAPVKIAEGNGIHGETCGRIVSLKFHGGSQTIEVGMECGDRLRVLAAPDQELREGDRVRVVVAGPVVGFPADR